MRKMKVGSESLIACVNQRGHFAWYSHGFIIQFDLTFYYLIKGASKTTTMGRQPHKNLATENLYIPQGICTLE